MRNLALSATALLLFAQPLQDLVRDIELGALKPRIGKVFGLTEIAEAHRTLENNIAGGKIVVLT